MKPISTIGWLMNNMIPFLTDNILAMAGLGIVMILIATIKVFRN